MIEFCAKTVRCLSRGGAGDTVLGRLRQSERFD